MERLRIEVPEGDEGVRLDALLAREAKLSRARAAALVAAGGVRVDGRVEAKSYRLSPGEVVEADAAAPEEAPAPPPLPPVVFEDEHLLVVEKPAGVVVHRAPGLREGTLVDALAASGRPLAPRAGEDRPGIVHRLDREVSGLLLVAKTDAAHAALVEAMGERRIRREYLAGVGGQPEVDTGKVDAPVGRDPRRRTRMAVLPDGKPAVTWFRVRERFAGAALLEVRLETGRTHQIRVHLSSIGHPVLGDATYGADPGVARRLGLDRPFLHAFRLALVHPVSGEDLVFERGLPGDLEAALGRLREP